ncbi:hypothetical protein DL96DRAFT_488617 [Flagelloscypha sp. PMI_526]|nr:hypothetical protein DL96DRAFT_488617 [Flagelloscypha sp. PMI_526]
MEQDSPLGAPAAGNMHPLGLRHGGNFVLPDPADMTNKPTDRDEYPYDKTMGGSDADPSYLPAKVAHDWTHGIYPQIQIPTTRLTAGWDPDIKKIIEDNEGNFVALVPFGSGNKYWSDNPPETVIKRLNLFLHGLEIEKGENFKVSCPFTLTPSAKSDGPYDGPIALLMHGVSHKFAKFLFHYHVFPTSIQGLAFTVMPFDAQFQPWTIATFYGQDIQGDCGITHACRALAALKKAAWNDDNFGNTVQRLLYGNNITGQRAELAVQATDSWDLHQVEVPGESPDDPPYFVWQLCGKPIGRTLKTQ